jgi:hypothetical protein
MKDLWHSFTNWIDHNRNTAISLVIVAVLCTWLFTGCSTTQSIVDPNKDITGAQLEREIVVLKGTFSDRKAQIEADTVKLNADIKCTNEKIVLADADLAKQDEFKAQILEFTGATVSAVMSGGVTGPAAANSALTLGALALAFGRHRDSKRKDGVIESIKENGA